MKMNTFIASLPSTHANDSSFTLAVRISMSKLATYSNEQMQYKLNETQQTDNKLTMVNRRCRYVVRSGKFILTAKIGYELY